MAKFMILYNSATSARDRMAQSSPEQMQAGMDAWMAWSEEAKKEAKFEFGMPLQAVSQITSDGVSDSSTPVGGYSTMEADSKDTIIELLKSHPHLKEAGNSIDVLELLSMPGIEA